MSRARIEIAGLKEFRRALKDLDAGLPRTIKVVLDASMGYVIGWARPRIPSRSGRAAASLKPRSGQLEARIGAGNARVAYYPWLDFGGAVGRGAGVQRDYKRSGRYLYPGLSASQTDITTAMTDGLTRLARDAGLRVD